MGKIIVAWMLGISLPITLYVAVVYTEVGVEVFCFPFIASLIVNIFSIGIFIANRWEPDE